MEMFQAEKRRETDERIDYLVIECWENDTTYISDGLIEPEFEFEITKENAIKMARTILSHYAYNNSEL